MYGILVIPRMHSGHAKWVPQYHQHVSQHVRAIGRLPSGQVTSNLVSCLIIKTVPQHQTRYESGYYPLCQQQKVVTWFSLRVCIKPTTSRVTVLRSATELTEIKLH